MLYRCQERGDSIVHINRECGPTAFHPNKCLEVHRLVRHMFFSTEHEQAHAHIPSESDARDLHQSDDLSPVAQYFEVFRVSEFHNDIHAIQEIVHRVQTSRRIPND